MTAHSGRQFQGVIPILCVSDFRASMAYYTEKLGFRKIWDWGEPKSFGCVSRDGVELFFCLNGQGRPGTWLYLNVADVDALHEELRGRGAKITRPPADESWGMRELLVEDPDGHTFRFGQAKPCKDLPVERVAVPVRLERRLAAVLKGLAAGTNRTVGEVLEETLLHTFDPVPGQEGQAVASPHAAATFDLIAELKRKHRLDYDSHANYRFVEKRKRRKK